MEGIKERPDAEPEEVGAEGPPGEKPAEAAPEAAATPTPEAGVTAEPALDVEATTEQPPGAEPAAEPGPETEPTAEPAPAAEVAAVPAGRLGGIRRYFLHAAISAGVLLFALAFFMAGFAAHAMLDDDPGGGGDGSGALAAAAEDDPAWGPEDATVTIEEFSDFQCPYCHRFATETLPKIKEAYGDQVRYIFRDYPLTAIHPFAQKAAEAGQCAHEQDVFWEFHDVLFDNQEALSLDDLKRYAGDVGADTGKFNDCLDSGKYSREVLLDLQEGRQSGVNGTPAFLINGMMLSGAQPFEQFQQVIDQALALEQ